MATQPALSTVPVYHWLLADGTPTGCGTEVEFSHWTAEGCLPEGVKLGDILTHEPASEDDRRRAAWAAEGAYPIDEAIPDEWLHEGEWARVGPFYIYPREPDFYIGTRVSAQEFRDVGGIAFVNIEAAIAHANWMNQERLNKIGATA